MTHLTRSAFGASLAAIVPLLLCAPVGAAQPSAAAGSTQVDPRTAALITRAEDELGAALPVAEQLQKDSGLAELLQRARGILIVPRLTRGAFLIGGQRGAGVLLARHEGRWSDPAFYSVHGMSLGLQAGAGHGALAMFLMSDKAVRAFRSNDNTWSVSGRSGLTVVRDSAEARERLAGSDVIVWTESAGLYGGFALTAVDVTPDDELNHAFYASPVAPLQILIGAASNPRAAPLKEALLTRVAAK